ncbi:hypothetical protein ACFQL1_11345 [Halomicroarcula sp. GCM10025709]|uniref:hypothetical protein n=1 Tax=Halomicroarcula sp. GCM10025709 TaxID=3252669 RepID=UPI00360D9C84
MLARLRDPEYTGENRCLPCTIVNSAIAVALAGAVGVGIAVATTPVLAGVAAALVLAVSALSIWLRGYLVPGTPELTKRYMPPGCSPGSGRGRPPGRVPVASRRKASNWRRCCWTSTYWSPVRRSTTSV